MRKVKASQILLLIFCLCLTGALLYLRAEPSVYEQKTQLTRVFSHLNDWQKGAITPLDPIIVDELKLDDYIFQSYVNESGSINLYVGYYYTSAKVGAAHDPLVCFPGQGWQVSDNQDHLLLIEGEDYEVDYSSLVAIKEGKKELVHYWYQAGDRSASGPFMQKLLLLKSKFLNRSENNAFIRVSTTLNDETLQVGRKRLLAFMNDFYPKFIKYVDTD